MACLPWGRPGTHSRAFARVEAAGVQAGARARRWLFPCTPGLCKRIQNRQDYQFAKINDFKAICTGRQTGACGRTLLPLPAWHLSGAFEGFRLAFAPWQEARAPAWQATESNRHPTGIPCRSHESRTRITNADQGRGPLCSLSPDFRSFSGKRTVQRSSRLTKDKKRVQFFTKKMAKFVCIKIFSQILL